MASNRHKKILVIYHGDCPDGFSGAWAAWKKFGNKAEYIGAEDRIHPPGDWKGKDVYFIDWTYPLETTNMVREHANKVVILDHHETAERAIRSVPDFRYDNAHSGATLAWSYFFPKKSTPKLLEYVEDSDLWRYQMKDAKAITAYLNSTEFDFRTWNVLARDFQKNSTRAAYVKKGEGILAYENKLMRDILDNAELVSFEGREVLAVNSPILHSELGHELAEKQPPFSIVWRVNRGKLRVSLRSVKNFDVASIAQKFGGGGHRKAAGFSLDANESAPWKRILHHHGGKK